MNYDGLSTQAQLILTLLLAPLNIVLAIVVFRKMGILLFDSLGANPVLHSELCIYILVGPGTILGCGHGVHMCSITNHSASGQHHQSGWSGLT